jgi:hypothetical protein
MSHVAEVLLEGACRLSLSAAGRRMSHVAEDRGLPHLYAFAALWLTLTVRRKSCCCC